MGALTKGGAGGIISSIFGGGLHILADKVIGDQPEVPTTASEEVKAAERRARRAAAARRGVGSSILTPSGGLGDAPVTKKSLLGE